MNTKTKLTGIATIVTVLALAGCAHSGPHGGHSEKWYEQHTAARHVENKWCAGQSFSTQVHNKSCERSGQAEWVVNIAPSVGHISTQLPQGSLDPLPSSTVIPSPKTP